MNPKYYSLKAVFRLFEVILLKYYRDNHPIYLVI